MHATDAFRAAIARAGLTPPETVIADGKIHRFPTNGRRDDDSGWYVFYTDNVPAGAFGCWRSGVSETWRADIGRTLTPAERAEYQRRIEKARRQAEAERERRHAEAAAKAEAIWDAASPAPETHPYLVKKKVRAHGVRVDADHRLIVPVRDADGALMSLERIDAAGEKRFLPGGRVAGGYHLLGEVSDVICVAEGYATAASIHQATGYPVAVAFSAGNLLAVAQALRARYPNATIIVCADHDASGVGQTKAKEAADAVGGVVVVPDAPGADWNDIHAQRGLEVVREEIMSILSNASPRHRNGASATEIIERLARLSTVEYAQTRKREAQRLGIAVSFLDRAVEAAKKAIAPSSVTGQGQGLCLKEIEPASYPVNGARLLANLVSALETYVVFPPGAAAAVALWCIWSHAYDLFDIAPRLALLSPEKRCGKTTLLLLLSKLTSRALPASNITPSAIFRTIEAARPTLLIDEFDSFSRDNDELRGILNSGHTRDTAFVIRVCGDDHEPRRFDTFCPLAIAAIGTLPETLLDRSVIIQMKRRAPGERVAKLDEPGRERCSMIAREIARWVRDRADALRSAHPDIPPELNDRAADNWRPLLAIADEVGEDWPERARRAALQLSGDGAGCTESVKTQLLADIRDIFAQAGTDRLASRDLCDRLASIDERSWAEWRRGKPLAPAQLSRMLRAYGVTSRNVRLPSGDVAKGYLLCDLEDVFSRYLPEAGVSKRYSATIRSSSGDEPLFQNATQDPCSVSENATNPAPDAACSVVAFRKAELRGEEGIFGAEEPDCDPVDSDNEPSGESEEREEEIIDLCDDEEAPNAC